MPSTAYSTPGSQRSQRRLYPWDAWILRGTPAKPLRLIVGKHVPKGHKLASLISQLHHYTRNHNASLKSKKAHIRLFTSRIDADTLLVYSVPVSAPPALFRGRQTINGTTNGNGKKPKPIDAPLK